MIQTLNNGSSLKLNLSLKRYALKTAILLLPIKAKQESCHFKEIKSTVSMKVGQI